MVLSGIVLIIWFPCLQLSGCYRSQRLSKIGETVTRLLTGHSLAALFLLAVLFLEKGEMFSRIFVTLFLIISGSFLLAERIALKLVSTRMRKNGFNIRYILMIGTGLTAMKLSEYAEKHAEVGWHILGYLKVPGEPGKPLIDSEKIMGDTGRLQLLLETEEIDEVIFTVDPSKLGNFDDLLQSCEEVGVSARVISDYFTVRCAKIVSDDLFGFPSLLFSTTPTNSTHLAIKRCIDIVGSAVGIILLIPLFVVTAAAIKIESTGPVLFKQVRVGLHGRRFYCSKFRSMTVDAEARRVALEAMNEQTGPVFKIRNDPRITRVGRIIRKFSIDELPQLFNVLRGDMSLVGIRPPLPPEVERYDRWQRRRLSMKPGITCLWQVNGRNQVAFDEWMRMDLKYIDNWSLKFDFLILLKTIPAVLKGSGQ
jgi:exopolysaccharide biosynthesis polyprenyl glycosylphosphotransferase